MLLEFISYLFIGVIAGTLSGLLGIGGGVIVVPSLILIFRWVGISSAILMHLAVGTSLAVMTVSSFAALRAHSQRGIAIWPVYKNMMPGLIVGTISGAILAKFLQSRTLEFLFGLIIILIAILMWLDIKPKAERNLPNRFGMFCVSFLIGNLSGLFGIGGGVIALPFLSYCNVALRDAVGITTAIALTAAIIGTLSFIATGFFDPTLNLPRWSTGFIYWPAVLGIVIVSPLFATFGAAWSHRLPTNILKKIFAFFLLAIGLKMLF